MATTILFADSDTNIDTDTCTKKLNSLNECSSVSLKSKFKWKNNIFYSILYTVYTCII